MRFLDSKKLVFLSVFGILVLVFGLRVYRLNLNSPPLYIDETAGHYLVWSSFFLPAPNIFVGILRKVFWGPLTFTWLFGLTPLGVRLPAALYGTFFLLLLYFFAKSVGWKGKENFWLPLITLFLGAFLPWTVHLSRIGYAPLQLLLILVSLHWIFYLRAKKERDYLLSLLPLLFSAYYYPSMLVIAPLIIAFILLKNCRVGKKMLLLFALSLIILLIFLFPRFSARGFDLAIWRDVNVTADSNLIRGLSRLSQPTIFSLYKNPELTNGFFYNYPISVINVFVKNYLSFFSPDFLFLKGDSVLRHSSGLVGEFFPFLFPFMIYGSFILFESRNKKIKELFLIWILVSPIPAAITRDGAGYLLRAVTMMPFLTYLSALGLMRSFELVRPKLRWVYLLGLLLVGGYSIYYFLFGYFHVYPALAAKSYEFGFKELSDFQLNHSSQSMLVAWDGYYPHFHFRFWQATPAKEYSLFLPKDIHVDQSVFHQMYPNLYFSLPQKEVDIKEFVEKNDIVYFAFPTILKERFSGYTFLDLTPLKTVDYPDGTTAFQIYQVEDWLQKSQSFENTSKVK